MMHTPPPPADATFPWHIAAPSFVIPAHIPENAAFLTGKVREVGLCFFESDACMAYGPDILPPALSELPLDWHVHLPLDLPWGDGGTKAADIASRLQDSIAHLAPRRTVLHPPHFADSTGMRNIAHAAYPREGQQNAQDTRRQDGLARFARLWRQRFSVPLLLENTEDCDLTTLLPVLLAEDCGVCLDVGHCLGYGQTALARSPELLARVALTHWSAPAAGDQHRPLTAFTPEQHEEARRLARALPPDTRHMLEIFSWQGIAESLPVLEACLNRPLRQGFPAQC